MTTKKGSTGSKRSSSNGRKKITAAAVYDELLTLHEQVQENREVLDEKIEVVNSAMDYIELVKEQSTQAQEQLAKSFQDLTTRVDNVSEVVDASMEEIKGNIANIQGVINGNLIAPTNVPTPTTAGVSTGVKTKWEEIKATTWWPWVRNIGVVLIVWFLLVNVVVPKSGSVLKWFIPNGYFPTINVNTPQGYATSEVSREPFRSDSNSRAAFGQIFARLDQLVQSGQLTDFEGYYNEFGREMQRNIDASKYNAWADFWGHVATLAHRSGSGANDLRDFNAGLQSAARVVSAPSTYFDYTAYHDQSGGSSGSSVGHPSPTGTNTGTGENTIPMRFGELPNNK